MKGVIIIGYQGIGKSSCAGIERCIDLESSNFFIGDRRGEDWFIPYCQIAMNLANQRYVVMTSSHKVVRDTFETMPKLENVGEVVVFCPTRSMKEEWIQRLQERYDRTGLFKDYKALMNAKERYDENIAELVNSPFPVYQPEAIDYDLRNYIHKIEFDWCMEGR